MWYGIITIAVCVLLILSILRRIEKADDVIDKIYEQEHRKRNKL